MTTGDPASRAADLVAGARRRATGNAVARALLRGAAVGALVAAAAAALSLAGGVRPGVWLLAALLPAAAAAAPGLRRARPSLAASALLLDRAAGTQERFVASLGARDPEVRDLVARQALDHPSVRSGRLPLTFPPSPEGLAAVLSAALLVGVLFLGPRLVTPGTVPDRREVGRVPAAAGTTEPGESGEGRGEVPAADAPSAPSARPLVTRLREGEEPSEGDWRALEAAGMTEAEREAIRAALAAADREAAAKAARAILERGRENGAAGAAPPAAAWRAFERAIESPGWDPRFDEVVRRYFTGAGQRGLR